MAKKSVCYILLFFLTSWESFPVSYGIEDTTFIFETDEIMDIDESNCTPPAMDDFPSDGLTREERIRGWILLHLFLAIYVIGALAMVCDDYFVPVMHEFSEELKLPNDVAGATLMAFGTTCPELFVALIGVFITEGDIGVGAVLGSAIFNVLVIASVCGIFAGTVVALNWRPLMRDCVTYLVAVATLCYFIEDEQIDLYEAIILLIEYIIYITVLYLNTRFQKYCRGPIQSYDLDTTEKSAIKNMVAGLDVSKPHISSILRRDIELGQSKPNGTPKRNLISNQINNCLQLTKEISNIKMDKDSEQDSCKEKQASQFEDNETKESHFSTVLNLPKAGFMTRAIWLIWWPTRLLFLLTIPKARNDKCIALNVLTFFMSIVYIACFSYLATWMVSIIGYTIHVPDSVMGLTFMALGNCLPEFISSIIVARQSLGNMALSNAMGGNLFALLVCLGGPWALKAGISQIRYVKIQSEGLTYSVLTLLLSVVVMFVIIALNKFRLDRKVGVICLILYIIYVVVSCLYEMNIFTTVNLPMCYSRMGL